MKEADIQLQFQKLIIGAGGYCLKNHGSLYSKAGTPDIMGMLGGVTFFIEFKASAAGKATEKQLLELKKWAAQGAVTGIYHNAKAAFDFIMSHVEK